MYVPSETGEFISEQHARISELIREYSSTLDVRWIPPANREVGDPPFCITEHTKDGKDVVVFYCEDLNEDILGKIYRGDSTKGNVLDALEAKNKATRAYRAKVAQDEQDEKNAIAVSILRSPKSVYRHNGVEYR